MVTQSYDNKNHNRVYQALTKRWIRFWMRHAGLNSFGRIATLLASWFAPPHKARVYLAYMNSRGYIEPSATIYHSKLRLGTNVFIGDHVIIFENKDGGPVELGDRVNIFRHTIIETAQGGSLTLEAEASIHPRCQLNAYKAPIHIGRGTMIAPNCAFYPYDHGVAPDRPIRQQPLQSKGGITIGSEAWLGVGVTVLGGVRIGDGAVIGAGSVVTQDVPDGGIALGTPARVVKMRSDLK
jgi:acetyltransferase-like isoleucine patch superfamily enzyme